jgi:hypothetical protein
LHQQLSLKKVLGLAFKEEILIKSVGKLLKQDPNMGIGIGEALKWKNVGKPLVKGDGEVTVDAEAKTLGCVLETIDNVKPFALNVVPVVAKLLPANHARHSNVFVGCLVVAHEIKRRLFIV